MNEKQKQLIIGELQAAAEQIKREERKCNGETRRIAHNKAIAYFDGYKQAIKNIMGIIKYENGEIAAIWRGHSNEE